MNKLLNKVLLTGAAAAGIGSYAVSHDSNEIVLDNNLAEIIPTSQQITSQILDNSSELPEKSVTEVPLCNISECSQKAIRQILAASSNPKINELAEYEQLTYENVCGDEFYDTRNCQNGISYMGIKTVVDKTTGENVLKGGEVTIEYLKNNTIYGYRGAMQNAPKIQNIPVKDLPKEQREYFEHTLK